jgi:hypothetical protein
MSNSDSRLRRHKERKLSPKRDARKQPSFKPKIFISKPLKLNIENLEKKFYRADLEFHGVDHSGPSYEGRVFINNPKADDNTPKTLANGYAGSYHIFGHGGCFGDVGHCEIRKERLPFDYRPSHPLTPAFKRIIFTPDKIKEIGKGTNEFTVTIVPIVAKGSKVISSDVVNLEKISIVTYNK